MTLAEPLMVTLFVVQVLEQLEIAYFVGGSLASSLYGIPRSTQDSDLVAAIEHQHVDQFVKLLKDQFYVDSNMIKDAIRRSSSFNIIYLETMFKVDIFVLKSDQGSQQELQRRENYQISEDPLQELYLASAEDIILHKLRWFKMGDEISTRQWNDAVGVLQVQRKQLDFSYMEARAKDFGIESLLTKLLQPE